MSIYDVFGGGNRPFDKEEWAAAKQAQRKEAYELIDNTCSEMMASGDSFRQYLDVQGRFDRYSVANAILVSAQMPEATQLKEYSKWKANRVYVNKDAQKIIILEPSKEYTREDGTKGISYNAKVVYDISETSAKDRQQEQEPKSMRELVSALIDASPVPCVPVGELELPAYYDSSQQTIFVKKGLSEEVLFMSMAKEVSAAVYDFKYNESRDVSDFKSFCVAYMVSSRYGMDTRGFDFSRLPREYAEMDTQAFKGELGTMRDVLGEIQSDMYKSTKVKFSGELLIDYSERNVYIQNQPIGLVKKEFDIVELLSQNAGQVFDKERIYERVFPIKLWRWYDEQRRKEMCPVSKSKYRDAGGRI